MNKKKIGLFGGTFNPIHLGHLRAAEFVQEKFSLDQVLFIPSFIPPHKDSTEVASPSHRLKMIELAVAPFSRFVASSIEIDAKGKSYSIVTLNKIKKHYPQAQIFFILGIDAFLEIDTWKDYEKVLEKCFFIVISRPGYCLEEAEKKLNKEYKKHMVKLPPSEKVKMDRFLFSRIFLLPMEALDIASTEVRKKIRDGASLKGLVPDTVQAYIRKNKIYQNL